MFLVFFQVFSCHKHRVKNTPIREVAEWFEWISLCVCVSVFCLAVFLWFRLCVVLSSKILRWIYPRKLEKTSNNFKKQWQKAIVSSDVVETTSYSCSHWKLFRVENPMIDWMLIDCKSSLGGLPHHSFGTKETSGGYLYDSLFGWWAKFFASS